MVEIYKDVYGYEGLYQISNYGNVKSIVYECKYGKQKILTPRVNKDGYLQVNLYKCGSRKTFLVHRLVAIAFIENPLNLPHINHKDENRGHNISSNLEWCDSKYNNNYGTHNQKISEKFKGENNHMYGRVGKLNPASKEVICDGVRYECIKDCAKYYNVPVTSMRGWLNDNDKNHKMPQKFIDMKLSYC